MKPLTIEELKALEVGDWVWLISVQDSDASYGQIDEWMGDKIIRSDRACITIDTCDYGERWLAYKNKEQAECKGEIVELPCKVGDKIFIIDGELIVRREIAEFIILQGVLYIRLLTNEKSIWDVKLSDFNKTWFTNKDKAEARLQELRGGE